MYKNINLYLLQIYFYQVCLSLLTQVAVLPFRQYRHLPLFITDDTGQLNLRHMPAVPGTDSLPCYGLFQINSSMEKAFCFLSPAGKAVPMGLSHERQELRFVRQPHYYIKTIWASTAPYCLQNKWKGRLLKFIVTNFNTR